MFKKSLLIITAIVCFITLSFAQDIQINATVDRNVISIDEQLSLDISVSGESVNIPNLELPSLPNFQTYSAGRSQNISIINGKVSSSLTFKYVLAPRSIGNFVIPSVVLEYKGQQYATQPINIEVVKQTATSSAPSQPLAQGSVPSHESTPKDLFITGSVDKKTAYVNEQITYTFRFFRRIRLTSNPQYNPPDFSGFWTEDLPPKTYTTVINGQTYVVTELKTMLFPTKPGEFNLSKATLECRVEDFNPNDFFNEDFFRSFFSSSKIQTLSTKPLDVNVLGLPETGKPQNFNGLVGKYEISSELDKKTTKVNEPVTLIVTISGTGNVKTIAQPVLPDWPDFRKYETVSSMNLNKDQVELKGSKTFRTVLVPLSQGKKTIPPISMSFFDTSQKKYLTIQTNPISLDVEQGLPGATYTPTDTTVSEVKVMSKDIHYIKTLTNFKRAASPIYNAKWFLVLVFLPLILFASIYVYYLRFQKLSTDIAYRRRHHASKSAKKYLKQAKSHLKIEHALDYYCDISKALFQYIADKMNVSSQGLTFNMISELLLKNKIAQGEIDKIKLILDECDMIRFAPSQVTKEMMEKTYFESVDVINDLDKGLK